MDISINSAAAATAAWGVEKTRPSLHQPADPSVPDAPSSSGASKSLIKPADEPSARAAQSPREAIAEAVASQTPDFTGVMSVIRSKLSQVSQELRAKEYQHSEVGGSLDILNAALSTTKAAHETERIHIGRIEKWITLLDRLSSRLEDLNPSTYTAAETMNVVEQLHEDRSNGDPASASLWGQGNTDPNTALHLLAPPSAARPGHDRVVVLIGAPVGPPDVGECSARMAFSFSLLPGNSPING